MNSTTAQSDSYIQANEALIIGNRSRSSATMGRLAFMDWLAESGSVDKDRMQVLLGDDSDPTAVSASNEGTEPLTVDKLRRAFQAYTLDSKGFREDGSTPKGQLWVYFAGHGARSSEGQIAIRAYDPSLPHAHVDLSRLVDAVKETGTYREVILIADIVEDPKPNPVVVSAIASLKTKQLPATIDFMFLSAVETSQQSSNVASRHVFSVIVVNGLKGGARTSDGIVTPQSLRDFVNRTLDEQSLRPQISTALVTSAGPFALVGGHGGGPKRQYEIRGTVGGLLALQRRAKDEELGLSADNYAEALATLFSEAGPSDFCFALYAPWGRGKTSLMDQVAKKLKTKHRYEQIFFSAWKYPSTPEVWIHLYESFAKAAYDHAWYLALPAIVRAGVAKRGYTRLMLAYLLFAIGLFPFLNLIATGWRVLNSFYPFLGIMGFVWLYSLWSSVRNTKEKLSKTYLSPTRHAEKLGLQATIGADLVALLKGWMPRDRASNVVRIGFVTITALALYGTWTRLTDGKALEEWGAVNLDKTFIIQAPLATTSCILVGLSAVLLLIPWYLFRVPSKPQRVLLVVDDLDRCSPQHLLSVMESIKLLLEDPDIGARVQVSMLIEEDILKHAILQKYKDLVAGQHVEPGKYTPLQEGLIRETCEKLFLAHLRLPPLSSEEVRELVLRFSDRGNQVKASAKRGSSRAVVIQGEPTPLVLRGTAEGVQPNDSSSMNYDPGIYKQFKEVFEPSSDPPSTKDPSSSGDNPLGETDRVRSNFVDTSFVFSETETEAIGAALEDATTKRPSIGPRGVKAFLFRYQLARLLLSNLEVDWDAGLLAGSLSQRFFDGSAVVLSNDAQATESLQLHRVVEQVA